MTTITLNGKPHELEQATSLAVLLDTLSITPKHVAVALNGTVVPRDAWADTRISAGDTVEIVRAVGGG